MGDRLGDSMGSGLLREGGEGIGPPSLLVPSLLEAGPDTAICSGCCCCCFCSCSVRVFGAQGQEILGKGHLKPPPSPSCFNSLLPRTSPPMTPAAPSPCAFSPAPSPFPELPNAPGAGLLLSPVPPAPPLRTERAWCILCCRPSGVEKAELAMRAATSASRAAVCDASALHSIIGPQKPSAKNFPSRTSNWPCCCPRLSCTPQPWMSPARHSPRYTVPFCQTYTP
mmetsp:Transcript_15117/g.40918  ORF Transcript_15117/g.40918 Transcript_15117/m.40918 type:complete len:225 (-) Transcript_15117:212-886(-)